MSRNAIINGFCLVPVLFLQKVYKSQWEKQREKGFELRLDSLSILTAKAKTDLASDVCLKKNCFLEETFVISSINSHFFVILRSNTGRIMRKAKAKPSALSRSVTTLKWLTLLWPPNFRATCTTRRTMRTPRPNTGVDQIYHVTSCPAASNLISTK